MSEGYVIAGYVVTILSLGGYALWILARGRRLSSRVPADRRRWS